MKIKMKLGLLALIGASVLATGCASRPEAISSSYVPHEKYMGLDCGDLILKQAQLQSALSSVSSQQNSAANIDFVTTFLFLIPASAISGSDIEGAVAEAKGEVKAIETAIVLRCSNN